MFTSHHSEIVMRSNLFICRYQFVGISSEIVQGASFGETARTGGRQDDPGSRLLNGDRGSEGRNEQYVYVVFVLQYLV